MRERPFDVRPARDEDRVPLARLFAAVAEERHGIAAEPPVDVDQHAAGFDLEATIVAVADDEVIGGIWIDGPYFGFGEIGMLVARYWRGRGVGSTLVAASIHWARDRGLHKLSLSVFPENEAALAVYRKFGFEAEGHRRKQIRRANGELWDLIDMGLLLTEE
ncbi:MAG: GNAT family N-acetyltransferase [Actinomycetota bacterium]|nr:GNAT family N-acetyltransferase [Actinomycetota bacterium]